MAKKAVYNNQHIAIYITQEHLDRLLNTMSVFLPVYIGKNETGVGTIQVQIDSMTMLSLKYALKAERQAVQEVQDQFDKDHPDYTSSTDIQRRQKRARKRLR